MNKYQILVLKSIRKVYTTIFNSKKEAKIECIQDAELASQIVYDSLMEDKPCMIARFGANELNTLKNYQSVFNKSKSVTKYITGQQFDWWWNDGIVQNLHIGAGFFPPTIEKIEKFCELMLQDIPEMDILGSWLADEQLFEKELHNSTKITLELLNPYFSTIPWTKALEGKKVLVVHPFAATIQKQYQKREILFKNEVLPAFHLQTIQAVQSAAGNPTHFVDWFSALDYMKSEIDKHDYDICLIGCGAYGFHLAAHVKRTGKKAVHLGGSLQLLFGIRGKRWENPNYNPIYNYAQLMNEYWVKPAENEKPTGASKVEGGTYW